MFVMRRSSTTPPRPRRVLSRTPRSVPSKTQSLMTMPRTSPDISLPITTPPWPCSIVQFAMITFSHGAGSADDASVPALMAMQSSPTSIWQSVMRTFRHDSGSMPSVFGESAGFFMRTPETRTSLHRKGWTVQAGEFSSTTSRIVTRVECRKLMRVGRAASRDSPRRTLSHQKEPPPSIVPRPVTDTLVSPSAKMHG